MSGPITWEMIGQIGAVLIFAGVVVGYINRRLIALEADLNAKIIQLQSEQTALHLQVTREYASVNHLEKVESRLVTAIDKLIDEVHRLREAWMDVRPRKD